MPRIINIALVLVVTIILISLLASCTSQEIFKNKDNDLTGKILFKGDAVSGSEDMYWSYEIDTHKLTKVSDQDIIKLLELRYYINLPMNKDEKFVVHNASFYRNTLNFLYLPLLIQKALLNIEQKKELNKFVDESNTIDTLGYTVKINENKHLISILNKAKGIKSNLTFKNYIFGLILSPDSKYLAFFLNDPTAFRDGSVYNIIVLNVATLKVYELPNLEVSMPGAMVWIR